MRSNVPSRKTLILFKGCGGQHRRSYFFDFVSLFMYALELIAPGGYGACTTTAAKHWMHRRNSTQEMHKKTSKHPYRIECNDPAACRIPSPFVAVVGSERRFAGPLFGSCPAVLDRF